MSYTVVWDDPHVEVRATISSRAEMDNLAKALANAEKHLPEESPPPAADKPEEKPHG